jgi:peroxiredoxin Q/BCP
MIKTLCIAISLLLSTIALALEVGDTAPDFSLAATDGQTYNLRQLLDQRAVVIAWYPKAFTSGCTIECKSITQNGHLLEAFDINYFMASVDPLEKNTAFAESLGADFPLLSDSTKEVAKAYDVLGFYGLPKRQTFYINKQGKILLIDRNIRPATSAEDIVANLEKLGIPKRPTN